MARTSNIPTGGAPLFLGDFATPLHAASQRITESMLAKLEKDKSRQAQEYKEMLRALDFKAVEGLSQKVAEEHLGEVNDVTNKWAKRWLDQGKKLSANDYLEMKRDKLRVEQNTAKKKWNVAQYANAQKELTGPGRESWHPASLKNLSAFEKEGNIGRDASGILVPRFDVLKHLSSNYEDISKLKGEETVDWDEKSPFYKKEYARGQEAVRLFDERIANDEVIQHHLSDPYSKEGERTRNLINQYRNQLMAPSSKTYPVTSSMLKMREEAKKEQLTGQRREWDKKGLDPKYFGSMEFSQDLVSRIMGKDQEAVDILKTGYSTGLGNLSDAFINPQGNIELVGEPNSKGDTERKILPIPKKNASQGAKRAAMVRIFDEVIRPMLGEKSIPGNFPELLDPDFKVDIKEKAVNPKYKGIRDMVLEGKSLIENRKTIAKELQELLKEEDVETGKAWWKGYNLKVGDEEFDFRKEGEDKRFLNWLDEKLGIEPRQEKSTTKYTLNGVVYDIPTEEETEFVKENPDAQKM